VIRGTEESRCVEPAGSVAPVTFVTRLLSLRLTTVGEGLGARASRPLFLSYSARRCKSGQDARARRRNGVNLRDSV